MDTMKVVLFITLLTINVLAQWSSAAPLIENMEGEEKLSKQRASSIDNSLRLRRSAGTMESPDPALVSSYDAVQTGFLSRLRRSLAQMYAGSVRYNNRRHGSRRHHRRMRHRHNRHHRRHRGGRVVDA